MANLFEFYIASKGKVPLYSHKDEAHRLLEPPLTGDYVGYLKPDILQLDFDEEKDAEVALKIVKEMKLMCDVLKTTRGIHLYFKVDENFTTQHVHWYNAIGLCCDIGLGSKNRVIPLRTTKEIDDVQIIDGEEVITKVPQTTQRPWIQTYSELEVVPCFFRLISQHDYNLKKCDARNQTLFTYIMTLQSLGFSREEVRKTIRVINKYVMFEPLSDKEIDTITRDDAFSKELFYDEKGRFLHDRFGNFMLANANILMIDRQPHIYTSDNLYSNNPDDFEKQMIAKIPCLKDAQRKEVYKYIGLKCTKKGEFSPPKFLGMRSSILDIETMDSMPYTPAWVINNRIGFDYSADSYHAIMDKTIDKVCCHDPQIRALLEEMIGYTLYRKNTMQVCFILTGEGSNGKSTMLNCIKRLVGKQNYTSLDLRELEENYKPAELYGKLANIGDDISSKFMESSSIFKKCVTGESFIARRAYGQPFELESYATQIFCANELPQVRDKSDGFSRRIVIVPFNAKFCKEDADYDPFIEEKLMSDDAIRYLLKLGIEGLKRVLSTKSFTKSNVGEQEKDQYITSNNNVLEWLEDEPKIENESVNETFLIYQVWCAKNGCQPVKKLNFSKELKKRFGFVSKTKYIDGKSVRVYGKEEV